MGDPSSKQDSNSPITLDLSNSLVDPYLEEREHLRASYKVDGWRENIASGIILVVPVASLLVLLRLLPARWADNEFVSLSAGLIGVLWIAFASMPFLTSIENSARIENLFQAPIARKEILRHIFTGGSYALYLREFEEYFVHHMGPGGGYILTKDPSEESAVNQISRHLPVFALANHKQSTRSFAKRIFLLDREWYEKFKLYSQYAALVVVDADNTRGSIHREVEWLVESGFIKKTLLVTTSEYLEKIRSQASPLSQARWSATRSPHRDSIFLKGPPIIELGVDVVAYLAGLDRQPRAASIVVVRDESGVRREYDLFDQSLPNSESVCAVIEEILPTIQLDSIPDGAKVRIAVP